MLSRWGLALGGAVLVAGGIALAVFTQTGPANDDAARDAIQTLLQQRHTAFVKHDLDGYMGTVDPGRVFLRTCEEQRFAALAHMGFRPPPLALGKTDTYLDYVRGWVDVGDGWERLFFRNDGAHWYVSEPTSGELGDDRSREVAGVTVKYRDAEGDLIEPVARDLPSIIDSVLVDAPSPPTHLFTLRIATLTSTDGRCFVAGEAGGYGTTQITLRQIAVMNRYEQLSYETTATVRHEALHWIQAEHSIRALERADWWLVEGWPYLLANKPTFDERRFMVCKGTPPTFSELRFGPGPVTPVETTSRYYTIASLLVERLYDKESGAANYWKLFDAFDAPPDATPYEDAIGMDGQHMYASWLESALARYC